MKKYDVELYPVVGATFIGVEAETREEAIKKCKKVMGEANITVWGAEGIENSEAEFYGDFNESHTWVCEKE